MFENFSDRALGIINEIKELSKEKNITKIGTEYLLYAMYNVEDSLCRFLFSEYNVSKEELLVETDKIFIIRKNDKEVTDALESIIKQATLLALDSKVSDEHLFMAVLMNQKCIASDILENLGLDVEDLMLDVKEIYDFNKETTEFNFTKNISKMARNNELDVFINIDDYIERLMIILKRKSKNNPILIGNAGVGKTALVEGLAMYMEKNKMKEEIVSLNIGSMLAGTKYRGDFEQRLDDVVNEIAKKKNIILFIDEIHTIVGAGTTENSLDVANMLKPFLARSDFKVIGATTPNEYHKTIEKDKALNRRFQSVFVKEPSLEDTKKVLFGIRESYSNFHEIEINDENLNYLIEASNRRIINKYRPDKCIDVLDEVLSYSKIQNKEKVLINDIDKVIDNILGYKKGNGELFFKEIEKYIFLHNNNLIDTKLLLDIGYQGNDHGYKKLLNDLKVGFGATDEMILELDMSNYNESHLISSLIGAPPGYVGYQEEGVLSKHILKYPISIIYIKNEDKCAYSIKSLFEDIRKNGFFYDRVGNCVNTKNVIIITQLIKEKNNNIGFFEKHDGETRVFDEIITYSNIDLESYNHKYIDILKKHDVELSVDFDISDINKKQVDNVIYQMVKDKIKGNVSLYTENNEIMYKTN